MKGFYIDVSNGLLTEEHKKRMGAAVWEFMWCLDKITKIDDEGVGWVLGGKPINLKDIAMGYKTKDGEFIEGIGGHITTISRNLQKLQKEGYINIRHYPHKVVVKVWKAKKRFSKNATSFSKNANPIHIRHKQKDIGSANQTGRKEVRFPKEDYELVLDAYQKNKGIVLQGKEFDPAMQTIKTMFMSGRTTEQIIEFMKWLQSQANNPHPKYDWTRGWTLRTVRMKLPEFVAGKLQDHDLGPRLPSYKEIMDEKLRGKK